jgi:hypothetical protein
MTKKESFLVPSPEELQRYQTVDPTLPTVLIQVRDRELRREFIYAASALSVAALGLVMVIGGFVYLVMQGHPTAAGSLLGAGVLGLIAGFIRARLRSQD